MNVGLVLKPGIKNAVNLASEIIDWAKSQNHQVFTDQISSKSLGSNVKIIDTQELLQTCQAVVVLGGDGSMIAVARQVVKNSPIFLGVKFGTLGFLTEIAPEELIDCLEEVVENKIEYSERTVLLAEVKRLEKTIFSSQAINDIVFQREANTPLIDLDVFCNNESVMRVRGDGLIVSSPTGSTAYSLATGGSIVHPDVNCLMLSPICPHSLTNRPLILPASSKLIIGIPNNQNSQELAIDGQVFFKLEPNDRVIVTVSKTTVKFAKSPVKTYFGILRSKLNWGTVPGE